LACHVLQKAALAALESEQPPHRSSVCWRSQHLVDTVIHRKHPAAVRGLTVRHKDGSALPIQVFLFGLIIQLPPARRDVDVFAKAASALANSNEGWQSGVPWLACRSETLGPPDRLQPAVRCTHGGTSSPIARGIRQLVRPTGRPTQAQAVSSAHPPRIDHDLGRNGSTK